MSLYRMSPPLIRGFTFGERFLSLTLILAYPVLAFLIGAMTQCIDFSQFAPSNLQTMIDGIWQTFITAIIVITFYELLRNYPEEKYIEQDELYDRKSQIVSLIVMVDRILEWFLRSGFRRPSIPWCFWFNVFKNGSCATECEIRLLR